MSELFEFERLPDGKVSVVYKNGAVAFAGKVDPLSVASRDRLLRAAHERLPDINVDDLERRVLQFALPASTSNEEAQPDDPSAAADAELAQTPDHIRAEAQDLLRDPELVPRIMRDIREAGIVGEHALALTVYLLGTSRLLPRPLAAIVQGSSSSGKSHVIDTIGSLFPPESTLLATDLTQNALYYLPSGSLRHRFVVAGERSRVDDGTRAEATRALREMLSSGELRKVLPQKIGDKDKMESIVIRNPGPIAYIESTTLATIFEEDKNRALLLASDDGDDQTRAVVTATAERYAGARLDDPERVKLLHRTAQRLLRRVSVQVPFAPELAERMPVNRPEARRAIHQVLAVVQAVALLHQFQRHQQPDHGVLIQATLADYRVARRLLAAPLARAFGAAVPQHVISFAEWMQTAVKPDECFTVAQLEGRQGCRWSRTSLYDLMKSLHAVGFLADAGRDGQSVKHRIAGPLPDAVSTWLPEVEDLE